MKLKESAESQKKQSSRIRSLQQLSGLMVQLLTLSEKLKRNNIKLMESYKCSICGYVYDPAEGDPSSGIEPGVDFIDLPADYVCPICGAGKDEFMANS